MRADIGICVAIMFASLVTLLLAAFFPCLLCLRLHANRRIVSTMAAYKASGIPLENGIRVAL